MNISQRTVSLLIDYLVENESQATLKATLMRHNLADADPGQDGRPFSKSPKARRASEALGAALESGKEDELVDLATAALRDHEDAPSGPEWVSDLLASLRTDGFTCTATTTTSGPTSDWSTPTSEIRWNITPLGYTGLPVAPIASDLATMLTSKGFTTAAGHYDQALVAFHAQNWASSNSQLRTTFESVLLDLAAALTGKTPAGGGAAIDALANNGTLDYGPEHYVRGLWKLTHGGGAHPGLSDEQDARHRMYSISAIVDFFARTYT